MRFHCGQFDIIAYTDVANVVEPRRCSHFLECVLAILDLWVIGRNTESDEAVGHRELFVHIHHRILNLVHQPVGRIEACGA